MRQLGLILFGASTYDLFEGEDRESFSRSAKAFEDLCTTPIFVEKYACSKLNLYDQPYTTREISAKIKSFISDNNHDDLIIYYCGHGHKTQSLRKFGFFLRTTDPSIVSTTVLNFNDLWDDLEPLVVRKQVFFVLDACHSGEVFHDPEERMDAGSPGLSLNPGQLGNILRAGTAVFTSNGGGYSYAPKGHLHTLFTGAVIDILSAGIPRLSERRILSWKDLCDEVEIVTRERDDRAPAPWIRTQPGSHRDVTTLPFFVNRAYVPPKRQSVGKEREFWDEAKDTGNPYLLEAFLIQFPKSFRRPLARTRCENAIKSQTTPELLERFVHEYPESDRYPLALARLAAVEWELVKGSRDVDQLRAFADRFKATVQAAFAETAISILQQEHSRWSAIENSSDPNDFEAFVEAFPESDRVAAARQRVQDLLRREQRREVLERFFVDHPNSSHTDLAWSRLGAVEWCEIQDCRDRETLRRFAERFSELPEAGLATTRIAQIDQEQAQAVAIERSTDPGELEKFLQTNLPEALSSQAQKRQQRLIAVEHSYEVLERFVHDHLSSKCYGAAWLRLAALYWQELQPGDDLARLSDFARRFQSTPEAGFARSKIAALETETDRWNAIARSKNPNDFVAFLEQFPNSRYTSLARERIEILLTAQVYPDLLEQFLQAYPASNQAPLARARLATIEWQKLERSRDPASLRTYISRFDGVTGAHDAWARLAKLKWRAIRKSSDLATLQDFVHEFEGKAPISDALRRIQLIKDFQARGQAWWLAIAQTEDISKLKRFLRVHGEGPLGPLAAQKLAALRVQRVSAWRRVLNITRDRLNRLGERLRHSPHLDKSLSYCRAFVAAIPKSSRWFSDIAIRGSAILRGSFDASSTAIRSWFHSRSLLPVMASAAAVALAWLYFERSPPLSQHPAAAADPCVIGATPDFDRIMRACAAEIQRNPDHSAPYLVQATLYSGRSDPKNAVASLDHALNRDPNNLEARRLRMSAFDTLGDLDHAVDDYEHIVALGGHGTIEPELRTKYAAQLLNRADQYRRSAKPDKALADYDHALRLVVDYPPALSGRALTHLQKHNFKPAIADYNRLIALGAATAEVYNNRRVAHEGIEDYDHAFADYVDALHLDPAYARVHLNSRYAGPFSKRADSYLAKGDLNAAIADYTRAIDLDPGLLTARASRALAYYKNQEFAAAIADYSRLINLGAATAENYDKRRLAYEANDDYDHALEDYLTVGRIDPAYGNKITLSSKYSSAFVRHGDGHLSRGDVDAALDDYNHAITLDPALSDAWAGRARAYLKKSDDLERALAGFDQALKRAPNSPEIRAQRRQAYAQKITALDDANLGQAIAIYDAATALDSGFGDWVTLPTKFWSTFYVQGNLLKEQVDRKPPKERLVTQYAKALQYYNMAVRIDPQNGRAFHLRCWLRAIAGTTPAQLSNALEDCQKAIDLLKASLAETNDITTEANYISALGRRGFVYLKLGQYQKAIAGFEVTLDALKRVDRFELKDTEARSLYGRAMAKRKLKITDGVESDIVLAKKAKKDIAEEFESYGFPP
jgi:tetratricopeptide (TPR) repeat protein